ncbi:unnamed protein product [Pleuronectes platessa]|uniref:Uncharacterized protein n=1 Tax=Pleuronectes platessa TaxID=8262 RepID=A0A9N7VC66_PLEPL|nr:unnamed protein product [Pleuronectes platessa]
MASNHQKQRGNWRLHCGAANEQCDPSLRDEANSQRSAGLCVIHRDLRESPSHPNIVDKRPPHPNPNPQPASHVNTPQQDPMDLRAVSVLSHIFIPWTLCRAMTTKLVDDEARPRWLK